MRATYISVTGIEYTFPVTANGKRVYVSIGKPYATGNESVQKAIERNALFLKGCVRRKDASADAAPGKEEAGKDGGAGGVTLYPDVRTVQEAAMVLRAEPYKAHHSHVNTPEKILKMAEKHSVRFPNLTF